MDQFCADGNFITNDTERSFVYEDTREITYISALIGTNSDPAHICCAKISKETEEYLQKMKIYKKDLSFVKKLLNDHETCRMLGIE